MRSLKGYSYRIKSVSVLRADWRFVSVGGKGCRPRRVSSMHRPASATFPASRPRRKPSHNVLLPACFSAFYASQGARTNRILSKRRWRDVSGIVPSPKRCRRRRTAVDRRHRACQPGAPMPPAARRCRSHRRPPPAAARDNCVSTRALGRAPPTLGKFSIWSRSGS